MYYKELDVLESKHNGTCFSGKFICVGETISKDLVVKCPVCSEDPELFGDGLFVMPKGDLIKGAIPCGCSKKPFWSDEQFKTKINRIIKENNINTKVLSIVGETKKTKRVNFICEIHGNYDKSLTHALGGVNGVVCPEHGEYRTNYKDLMRDLYGCPKCAGNEYNEAYINIIEDRCLPIALKFGISNKAEKRIIKQRQGSVYNVEQLGVWKFDNTDSCKEAEITIKRKIETSYLSKSEFADGYTETCHPNNLQIIIDTYESFGGILIS